MLALSRPEGCAAACPRRVALPRRAARCVAMSTASASPRVPPVIVVGAGRVGAALERMGDGQDVVMRRGDAFPASMPPGTPILVATRNDALASVVDSTPEDRRRDLVFMQNGMLQPWQEERGLGDATQVLIYFAVANMGDMPTDGKTDLDPEGLTAACGPHAEAVAQRLQRQGLACRVLDKAAFKAPMLEKLIWISAFMLVGACHPGATVGDVEAQHNAEVCALIEELAAGASAATGAQFGPRLSERLCAYARSVAHFPTAVKEFEWRNGWFHGISLEAAKQGKPDPFPKHTALLKQVKAI